ncbi:MAG TPA: CCA tRNA nucleotidyltransferase [Exilispira sp.]|nr:CCA tRNA nucleotidyltransferase [Spirochaetota bacterium]NLJ04731.1 CCA tRNA nucleotidyltransferase [Exilispira sp.]HQQ18461.1 CCA tRNA nucleotidyltransferase [Exilispira sp.]
MIDNDCILLSYQNCISKLRSIITEDTLVVLKTIKDAGYQAYLVGGYLRDILLGRADLHKDVDIATDAFPQEIMELFNKVIPTGIKHGTVTVIFNDQSYEITTFRIDEEYGDLRHPNSVRYVSNIHEDLSRRDFTINALAYDPFNDMLIDDFQGIEDLKRRIIRTVGNPSLRFNEDALRIFRAIRFSSTLMFEIEEETFKQIKKSCDLLKNISKERIRDEFNKLLLSDKPSFGIELLRQSNILSFLIPELNSSFGEQQNEYHLHDVYYHSLYSCDASSKSIVMRIAALFHDVGKPRALYECKSSGIQDNVFYNHEVYSEQIALKFLTEYRYSKADIDIITKLIRYHMFHYTQSWTDGAVRRFVSKVGEDLIPYLFALRVADRIGNGKNIGYPAILMTFWDKISQVIKENHALKITDLAIDGNDIMKTFGLKPSKLVGNILKALLELVLDDQELNKKEILLYKAEEIYKKQISNLDNFEEIE